VPLKPPSPGPRPPAPGSRPPAPGLRPPAPGPRPPASGLRPQIGITCGDPAGIGPEIARRAAADARVTAACEPVLYGPSTDDELRPFQLGRPTAESGRAAYEAIVKASADAARGTIGGIATAPISKEAFALAGLPWRGHTELLQHLTGAPRVAMLFHTEALTVTLATIHVPIAEVPRALTPARLQDAIELTAGWMPLVGITRPRIAVAGLNPHAGEAGLIGTEDRDIIAPVVAACQARGIDVAGPFPADSLFARWYEPSGSSSNRRRFDAAVACYHDQGLIPVKLLGLGRAVNVTLGLPIVRTSVDHGTAYDIAGRGEADHSSLVEAILLAARLACARFGTCGTSL
jgi:4-hydroxythreonine-4-phosphate dehydrogenase